MNSLADAQGVFFQCPKCVAASGHYIDVTFADRGALQHQGSHGKDGKPTRWKVSGSDFTNLTTTPSILIHGGCEWHGYITNGDVN